jgi:hypothetical protein
MDFNFEKYINFRGYHIWLQRDGPLENWYIRVTAPDGSYAYDGWWRDSEGTTWKDALKEAKRGACIGM